MDDADLVLQSVADLTAEVRAMRSDLAAVLAALTGRGSGQDPRHTELLEALAAVVLDDDLAFDCPEVLRHACVDHRLALALEACRATDSESLGLLFRTLKAKAIGGFRLDRDGRQWRLVRV